jgi:hypothetical protein
VSDCTSSITFLPWVSGESLSPKNFDRHMGSLATGATFLSFTPWASSESITASHLNAHMSNVSIFSSIPWVSGESVSPSNLNRHLQGIIISVACPPAPQHLAFNQEPQTATSAETMTPAPTVEMRLDADDSVVSTFTGDVTIVIGENIPDPISGTPGVLTGTTTVAAVAGVATFDALIITTDIADTNFVTCTLIASASGVSNSTSTEFDVGFPA